MDQYQEFLLKSVQYFVVQEANELPEELKVMDEKGVQIIQNENYKITKYLLFISKKYVESVTYAKKKYSEQVLTSKQNLGYFVVVPVDFDHKQPELILEAYGGAVEPIHVPLVFVDADKGKFDAKEADRIRRETASKAQIRIATGTDLVNVYFQPCCDTYKSTTIELYNENMLLGKFKVDEGMFFKAITGLAFGHYEIKLIQFDRDGKELFVSDPIPFDLKEPSFGGGNGRRTI